MGRLRSKPPTAKQQRALNVALEVQQRGVPPTMAELAGLLGLGNPASAQSLMYGLERRGYAQIIAGRWVVRATPEADRG